MKMRSLLNEGRIISPLTWHEFAKLVKYILENGYAQSAIEGDVKFANQLRKTIKKLQDDFEQ